MITVHAFRILARRALHDPMAPEEQLTVYESLAALAGASACREEERRAATVVEALRQADAAQLCFAELMEREVAR